MTRKTHAVIVATVELGNASPADVENAMTKALAALRTGFATKLVPCGWEPDPDTVLECANWPCEPEEFALIDMNPYQFEYPV